jgi:hypothetical protein
VAGDTDPRPAQLYLDAGLKDKAQGAGVYIRRMALAIRTLGAGGASRARGRGGGVWDGGITDVAKQQHM